MALLRQRGAVALAGAGKAPSLVAAIVGAPVRGSWWGHPEGKRIFAIASAIEDSPEVLSCRLVGGRAGFVHRALFPALYRLVTDRVWRERARRRLGPAARRLLDRVERTGETRADDRRLRLARGAIEKALLVHSEQVHTASGRHATILRPWRRWANRTRALAAEARALDIDEAKAALRAVGADAAVLDP